MQCSSESGLFHLTLWCAVLPPFLQMSRSHSFWSHNSVVYIRHPFFVYSFLDGYLCWFHTFALGTVLQKHTCTSISLLCRLALFQTFIQEWNRSIIYGGSGFRAAEPPYWFPFMLQGAVCKGSFFSCLVWWWHSVTFKSKDCVIFYVWPCSSSQLSHQYPVIWNQLTLSCAPLHGVFLISYTFNHPPLISFANPSRNLK